MLTPRRIQIFKAIVDEFIKTAEPIGSKALQERYHLAYSSATIRNDMQVLEEMGYLEKNKKINKFKWAIAICNSLIF